MEIRGSNVQYARESSDHAMTRASAYRLRPTAYGFRPTAYGLPPTGFTLIEMLVVMAIIVLVILMAIPAIQSITGTRSVGAAQNTLAALITRAREEAVGFQEIRGVMFYIDPATNGVAAAIVHQVPPTPPTPPTVQPAVFLDLVPNRDFLPMPKGIGVQTLINASLNPLPPAPNGVYASDAYLGFNPVTVPGVGTSSVKLGGVILFDGDGRLVSETYGLKLFNPVIGPSPTLAPTPMGQLFYSVTPSVDFVLAPMLGYPYPNASAPFMPSQIGLVLYDRQTFLSQGFTDGDTTLDPVVPSYGVYGAPSSAGNSGSGEGSEEGWLDKNATPILINRYNGTVIRGE